MAATRKKREPKSPETPLQAIFIKRVREELESRQWSLLTLATRHGGPAYKTLHDAIERGAVPGMTLIYKTAFALEMQPFELLRESDPGVRKGSKVVPLRTPLDILPKPQRELRKSLTYRRSGRK